MATQSPDFISTYALLIANELLKSFNISMTTDALKGQIYKGGNAFYKQVLRTQTSAKVNDLYLNQWDEISETAEQELATLTYAIDAEKNSDTVFLQDNLNSLKKYLQDNHAELNQSEAQQKLLSEELEKEVSVQMEAWHKLQEQHAEIIMLKFDEAGLELPLEFKNQLIQQLLLQGTGVKVPADILANIKLPIKSQKALIGAVEDKAEVLTLLNLAQEELRQIEKNNKVFITANSENFKKIIQANKSFSKILPEKIEYAKNLLTALEKQKENLPKIIQNKMEQQKSVTPTFRNLST